MQGFWDWLRDNSTQLQTLGSLAQAVGSIAAVLVAIALAFVARWQAKAADSQAKAADAQAKAANTQISTSIFIADKMASPNISITGAVSRDGIILKGRISILNNGNGVASNLKLVYRDQSPDRIIPLASSTLVVRDSVGAPIDEHRAVSSGLTLSYTTAFSTEYALDFDWDSGAARTVNEKLRLLRSDYDLSPATNANG